MTFREIIYAVSHAVTGGGILHNARRTTEREIRFLVNNYRAKFIEDINRKEGFISGFWVQDLGVKTLTKSDASETLTEITGCQILFTDIPPVVLMKEDMGLYYIGGVDKQTPFYKIDSNMSGQLKFTRFNRNFIYYSRVGNRVYIYTDFKTNLKKVNIKAILQDPMDGFQTIIGKDKDENIYPLENNYCDAVINSILRNEYNLQLQIKPDVTADAASSN